MCQGESAPGFPAHFNSVSASTARRFTPPGASVPSAGTHSASPTHLSPGMESVTKTYFAGLLTPGSHSLSFRSSNSDSFWQLEFSNQVALRDYLTSPCAWWCGRALSSSWKLPPRGARRARPGGGEPRGRTRPLSRGRAPHPRPPPRGEGREGARGGGEGAGHGNGTGGGFPPHPPPREQRVPAAAPCRSRGPAARGPARPRQGRRGCLSRQGRGNTSKTYKN